MTLGSEFRETATELIEEFAGELGKGVFKSLVKDPLTSYDPETGVYTGSFTPIDTYMAGDKLTELLQQTATLEYRRELLTENSLVYIAGDHITGVKPKEGDIVEPPWSSHGFRVTHVDGDMYKALWILYVTLKPAIIVP